MTALGDAASGAKGDALWGLGERIHMDDPAEIRVEHSLTMFNMV